MLETARPAAPAARAGQRRPCAGHADGIRSRSLARWLLAILLTLTTLCLLPAHAAPRIGVLTMQPGEVFWERFGHDAIVVVPAHGEAISYNFGYFDPAEPDFVSRFVRGRMRYRLLALPLQQDLEYYRESGRGVSVQWLDLTDIEADRLAAALAENARPENAHYAYDYFRDNCATRVRDALDRALDGRLRRQLVSASRGNTYRSEAGRLAAPAPWMWLGFQLGLGPEADRALSRWDEAFIPMRLAGSLREVRTAAGTPLVLAQETWLPHRLQAEPSERPLPLFAFGLAGVVIALALWRVGRRRPRWVAAFALPFWLACGMLGALMLYLWFGTAHWAAWRNHNLLLLNPLAWLLLPGAWRLARGRAPGRGFRPLLLTVAGIAALSLLDAALGIDAQRNGLWIALLLPIHLALAARWAGPTPGATIAR